MVMQSIQTVITLASCEATRVILASIDGASSTIRIVVNRVIPTARPKAMTRPTASTIVRETTNCSSMSGRPGIVILPVSWKTCRLQRRTPTVRRASDSRAATSNSGRRPARWGCANFRIPNLTKVKWLQINRGPLDSWDGYTAKVAPRKDREAPAPAKSHLIDGSIEPPYRIGMSCGACHIAFDPVRPPKDPAHPKWENLSGTVGNQYGRFAQILGSGMAPNTIEHQIYGHSRPGTVDTSAIPNDQVNNAGTMNAIINLVKRPRSDDRI